MRLLAWLRDAAWADRFAAVAFAVVMVTAALVVVFAPGPKL